MRNLGAFFGHVINGVKTTPAAKPPQSTAPAPAAFRQRVEEKVITTPAGEQLTLRRTITDEVRVQPPTGPAGPTGPH